MKKRNLKHNGLKLTKNMVSHLNSAAITGGLRTESCLADADTNCATDVCGTNIGCPSAGCPTNGCPPTGNCQPSISCEPVGIC
ncbi:hypothetical protein [Kordia zhangzhouensis]|uniref:hypothetical protein n=1 Tax=Kordia zhangzhouensis TaxID=1620405 RepID=UPI00062980B4|nr:hypothetical protein [Kordia zhangzhouensis]